MPNGVAGNVLAAFGFGNLAVRPVKVSAACSLIFWRKSSCNPGGNMEPFSFFPGEYMDLKEEELTCEGGISSLSSPSRPEKEEVGDVDSCPLPSWLESS